MKKKIKEVNGVKVIQRHSLGSIFYAIFCLLLVAIPVTMLFIPWFKITATDGTDTYIASLTAINLIKDTISPLLGNAPSKELVDNINKKILSYDGIIGLHDLIVHNYGVARCFASVHCEVCAEQDIMISHDIIDNIERDFLRDYSIHLVIHIDPIVTNDTKTNELKVVVTDIINKVSDKIGMHDFRVVWGISHSNLIFDVVAPFDFHLTDCELIKCISEEISKIDETYNTVITIDHE